MIAASFTLPTTRKPPTQGTDRRRLHFFNATTKEYSSYVYIHLSNEAINPA